MKKQSGFTLIELVVVIVILGILAVSAIPKFMDVQSQARAAVLQGVGGAVKSANGIVYGQASIQGVDKKLDGTIHLSEGVEILTTNGHILANADQIEKALDTDINYYDVVDFYPNGQNGPKAQDATIFTFEEPSQSEELDLGYPMKAFENDCYIVAYNDPTTTSGTVANPRRSLIIFEELNDC